MVVMSKRIKKQRLSRYRLYAALSMKLVIILVGIVVFFFLPVETVKADFVDCNAGGTDCASGTCTGLCKQCIVIPEIPPICICQELSGQPCNRCVTCSRGGTCAGGAGCYPTECECRDGVCYRTDTCDPVCPPGYDGCWSGNCISCTVVCDPCGNSVTCWKDLGGDGGEECGNGILEGGENCEFGDPSGYSCPWGWNCPGPPRECNHGSCRCEDCDDPPDCVCNCDCSGLTVPSSVTPEAPVGGVKVDDPTPTLQWANVSQWGQDQKDCTNGIEPCNCTAGESGLNDRHTYDVYFGTNGTPSLPGPETACTAGNNYTCTVLSSELTITSGNYHYPLQPGTTYYWAVRAVNRGPNSGPNNGVTCTTRGLWTPVQSFVTGVPPEILNIEILDNELATCRDSNDTMTGWTGAYDPASVTHNPIDVAMTIRDADGYEDIDTAFLIIAPENDIYLQPNNCHDSVVQYLLIKVFTNGLFLGYDYRDSTSIEVPEAYCRPNCFVPWNADPNFMESQCNAKGAACYWDDYQAGFWGPYGCSGCQRDWAAVPWDRNNPYRKYDPSCQYPNPPYPPIPPTNGYGEFTGCHGCYYTTVHPEYEIENISYTVQGSDTIELVFRVRFTEGAGSTFDYGEMQMYGMARTYVPGGNVFSGYPNCNIDQPCYTTDPSWTWNFDFTSPTGVLDDRPVDPDLFYWDITASDPPIGGSRSSGLKHIYGFAEHTPEADPSNPVMYDPMIDWEWNPAQPITKQREILGLPSGGIQVQGGDTVLGDITVTDIACNSFHDSETAEPGHEWIMTRLGFVYGHTGLRDPMPNDGAGWSGLDSYYTSVLTPQEVALVPAGSLFLSSDWIGSTPNHCTTGNYRWGGGWASGLDWCSGLYWDCNSLQSGANCPSGFVTSWYDDLYSLAQQSYWVLGDPPHPIVEFDEDVNLGGIIAGANGIFEYIGGSDLSVTEPVCNNVKVIFIPNNNLSISPNFERSAGSSCLFVMGAGTTVTITEGVDNDGNAEILSASVVSDGIFEVEREVLGSRYDPLLIRGMVFADQVSLRRDLVYASNLVDPAELLIHQLSQYNLLREMLGSRYYGDFECGTVSNAEKCEDWVLP